MILARRYSLRCAALPRLACGAAGGSPGCAVAVWLCSCVLWLGTFIRHLVLGEKIIQFPISGLDRLLVFAGGLNCTGQHRLRGSVPAGCVGRDNGCIRHRVRHSQGQPRFPSAPPVRASRPHARVHKFFRRSALRCRRRIICVAPPALATAGEVVRSGAAPAACPPAALPPAA